MSTITHLFKFLLPAVILSTGVSAGSSAQIILYTPYTSISVPPGETIDYTIDVKNEGTSMQALNLYMSGLPQGWRSRCHRDFCGGSTGQCSDPRPCQRPRLSINLAWCGV